MHFQSLPMVMLFFPSRTVKHPQFLFSLIFMDETSCAECLKGESERQIPARYETIDEAALEAARTREAMVLRDQMERAAAAARMSLLALLAVCSRVFICAVFCIESGSPSIR